MNPESSTPFGRRTRKHSFQTGRTSGTNTFEAGWKTRSNCSSSKQERSAISPCTQASNKPSLPATSWSLASCSSERSKLTTFAPAADKIGACWPPAEARQRTRLPAMLPNQGRGTGSRGVKMICQSPDCARRMVSESTGLHHALPSLDSLFQARRLCCKYFMMRPNSCLADLDRDCRKPRRKDLGHPNSILSDRRGFCCARDSLGYHTSSTERLGTTSCLVAAGPGSTAGNSPSVRPPDQSGEVPDHVRLRGLTDRAISLNGRRLASQP
jgi:hypothetical protein